MFGRRNSPVGWLVRHGPRWRTWIVVLVVAFVGATSASTGWHGAHGTDQGCMVCQLRHHTVADLDEAPRIWPLDTPEPVESSALIEGIAYHQRSSIAARAPPA